MPIVTVQQSPRDVEKKRSLVAGITQAFVDAYAVDPEHVQVFIQEVDHETGRRRASSPSACDGPPPTPLPLRTTRSSRLDMGARGLSGPPQSVELDPGGRAAPFCLTRRDPSAARTATPHAAPDHGRPRPRLTTSPRS